jgi:hypothetical protein
MRIEITQVLVDEHVQRLREAAQAPARPLAGRIWAIVRRSPRPASTASIPRSSHAREIDRLAA